jgi:D-alanyl-D-alanine carboxypeptidase
MSQSNPEKLENQDSRGRVASSGRGGGAMKFARTLALALCACLWSSGAPPGAAQAAQEAADWKAWLDSRAAEFSGVALVARGDTIEVVASYGLADRSSGRQNHAETRFNLGSINKTFTAIAIAQLIQQGRLSLDDTLAKHLPDYPNTAAAAQITIWHLVTHRSGVAQFMGGNFGEGSVAEMANRVSAEPQTFEPGERQQYSNGGYVVLGRVVEVVSGMSYSAYVSEKIYRPAGMTNSGFFQKGEPDAGVALGYFSADAQGRPMMGASGGAAGSNPPRTGNPAGGGYSTAADLFKFARALRGGRLLDARMTEYVMNGTFSGESGPKFGFALREQTAGARRFIGNGGGAPGVNAEFRFEPAGDYTVVVLANSSPPAATRLLTEILNRLGPSSGL